MGQTEIIIFLVLANAGFLILIGGIFIFVFKYRKRKIEYNRQIEARDEKHRFELMDTQLKVQQQTMQYIGREIHDSVAQKLTLASIYTGQMHNKATGPESVKPLESIIQIINDSLTELRQLSRSLTDARLQQATLPELIQIECGNINATGVCSAGFINTSVPRLDIASKSSLLRVVQEFIQNSLKYASCSEIKIELEHGDGLLRLLMRDNGKGFDLNERKHKGMGLDNMKRRVLALDGEFTMESAPGKGTSLEVTVPIPQIKNNV